MKYTTHILLAVVCALVLSSCVTSRKVNLMQETLNDIPNYVDTLSYEDYLLRKEDRLYIQVYSINEKVASLFHAGMNQGQNVLNGSDAQSDLYSYVVDEQGNITFPTVGKVHVLGLTARQVKHLLEDQLSGLLTSYGDQKSLSVQVHIVGRSFSVIGPEKSGRFPINKEKVTIFEALSLMGDLSDFASRSDVMLIREVGDSTVVKTFDLRSKEIVNSEFYYIEPNDVLYIRNMKGYSFGINHVSGTISVVASTLSFGVFIYSVIQRIVVAASPQPEEGGGE